MRFRRPLALLTCFAATAFVSERASASGYLTARYGADNGSPAMSNAFAIYYNPAALGGTKGTTITGDVSAALRWAQYDRTDPTSPSIPYDQSTPIGRDYHASNVGKASLMNFVALPFLGFNTDFGGKLGGLRAGYAFYIPYGGSANWDRRPDSDPLVGAVPGAKDGPQRWHNISGQILAIYNTVALAYELPYGISIGASFSPVINTAKTVRARNLDGSDNTLSPTGKLIEGRSLIEVMGINAAVAFGVHFDPLNDHSMKLGFSYSSQPGFGDTVMSGNLTQQLGDSPPGQPTKVDLRQAYPDVFRLGFSWRISPKWELHSDAQYLRWSWFKNQCLVNAGSPCTLGPTGADLTGGKVILNIPANWKDTFGARAGVTFWPTETLSTFASMAFSTPAVPASTINAATIDAFRVYATIGARVELGKHLAIAGSYNHIFFLDVNTQGGSQLYNYSEPSKSPAADGTYKTTLGFFNVNAAYTF